MAQGALDGDDFALVSERDAVTDKVAFCFTERPRLRFALETDTLQRGLGGCAERSCVLSREGS